MAKRFIDTEIWSKSWFRKLSPEMKCVWIYLCTKCDFSGFWDLDLDQMSFLIGKKITKQVLIDTFGDKFILYKEDKIFLNSFIDFQYGALNEANRVHKSILLKIEKEGPYKVLTSPLQGAKDKDKDKDMDKDKDKDKEKDKDSLLFDFEVLYRKYPLKEGKSEGLKKCKSQVKTREDYDALSLAIDNYVKKCIGKEKAYIKHFSTFMTNWKDEIDPDSGTTTIEQLKQKTALQIYQEERAERRRNEQHE